VLGAPPDAPSGPFDSPPRLAFGPDGLLYVLLPTGAEFDREPSASRPLASMLRLQDDGRVADAGPLSGIAAHPLGFAWHPATSELWLMEPGDNGSASLRSVAGGPALAVLRFAGASGPDAGALAFEPAASPGALAAALAGNLDPAPFTTARLAAPVLIESVLAGVSGRIGDVGAGGGGTLFLATSRGRHSASDPASGGDVILRLRPRPSP
jgi:glucose/arabinose dehydrogenase